MKNKIISAFCVTFLSFLLINAQDRKLKKAQRYFDNLEFVKAIKHYERIVAKGSNSPEVLRNLGDANYLNANYAESAKWYKKLSNLEGVILDKNTVYRYAQSLRSIKEYEASDKLIVQLNNGYKKDQRGINFKKNDDYLNNIKKRLGSYTIQNVSVNSLASDFAPSFYLDGLVFSTTRDTSGISKNIHTWNQKRFLDLFSASINDDGSLENVKKFSKKINTKLHESSSAFTKDGKTVYFTRNNAKSRGFSRDKEGVSRLKIYKSELINGNWTEGKALPFNQDDYSVAHPSLNISEDKLYFSSDMPSSLGHSDIFVVAINSDGTYSEPKNLGSKINTESKESFPFISENNVLYFSSDGHPGLGGMDVFATDLNDIENSKVVNLAEPINSISDDFSFIINDNAKKGYFASNRVNGVGSDDIYALTEVKTLELACLKSIRGVVKETESLEIIPGTTVLLLDKNGKTISSGISDENGVFKISLKCSERSFTIVANKEEHEAGRKEIETNENDLSVELFLNKIDNGAPIGADLAEYLKIEPIYFDFDKWSIREDVKQSLTKIIDYLKKHPKTKIQIGSHTDSRASKAYNMRLSDKRANSTLEYLLAQGVAQDQIRALGFGESMISNECWDGVKCDEHKHQENRRSEFIVIE